MNADILRQRVRARLTALDVNPFEAARRAGLERSFLNDLLIGKKSTVRQAKLPALAKALECDQDYLTGLQGTPRAGGPSFGSLPVLGIVEAGVWREPGGGPPKVQLPLGPDPRYPSQSQVAFLVRGDHAGDLGINDGSVVVVFTGPMAYRDGDPVVVRRGGVGKSSELSIRVVSGGSLIAKPAPGSAEIESVSVSDAEIVGLVLSSHRVFGSAN